MNLPALAAAVVWSALSWRRYRVRVTASLEAIHVEVSAPSWAWALLGVAHLVLWLRVRAVARAALRKMMIVAPVRVVVR